LWHRIPFFICVTLRYRSAGRAIAAGSLRTTENKNIIQETLRVAATGLGVLLVRPVVFRQAARLFPAANFQFYFLAVEQGKLRVRFQFPLPERRVDAQRLGRGGMGKQAGFGLRRGLPLAAERG
jgi:hypothetical protein